MVFNHKRADFSLPNFGFKRSLPSLLKLHEKPWTASKIQKLTKHQDKLLRKLKRNFTYDTEYLYKKFKNMVVSEIRSSKIDY